MSRPARYDFPTSPVAAPGAIVAGDKYRFTVLTDGLLRFEWAEDGKFEDRASTFAIRRKLAVPEYYVWDRGSSMEIITNRFQLTYNKQKFSSEGFSVQLKGSVTTRWTFGQYISNLGGTIRTLDGVDGRTGTGLGVLSRDGLALIDDTKTMLFTDDAWIAPRRTGDRYDGYLFMYGHDYREAMRAYFAVSGSQPLLPRFALGNWWSRYHRYTREEYLDLQDHFDDDNVPMSVAVLDMDWHLVQIPPGYGSGWTGYTWNRDLFPDPPAFLEELKDRKLKVTLNVHPADGIRAYEEQYPRVAEYMGIDPASKQNVPFDSTDKRFMDAYFDVVHHEHEANGVDFWWIDWQQGDRSKIEGIDPLWVLNHLHFLDNGRDNQRALILSRFGGPGAQRYQIGFSGDTVITWASLEFQPEFTATASNIGYGWWSHDIGGHMHGYKDEDLMARWLQLGCFSPILRLHSSNNIFTTREPWTYSPETKGVMEDYMRLRHRLIPYLYTMNARSATDDEPLVQPIYWDYPDVDAAYKFKNQFRFGSQLLVAPITRTRDTTSHLASVQVWLPPKRYVDVFSGVVYDGNRELSLHRPLTGYPVLAPEGGIVPLDAAYRPENGAPNPTSFELLLVVGADGFFELIEDDGTGTRVGDGDFQMIEQNGMEAGPNDVKFFSTPISYKQETGVLRIGPTTPSDPSFPKGRDWKIRLIAYTPKPGVTLTCRVSNGKKVKTSALSVQVVENGSVITLGAIPSNQEAVVELGAGPQLDIVDPTTKIWPLVDQASMDYDKKEAIWYTVTADQPVSTRVSRLQNMGLKQELLDAILELMLADSRYA